MTRQQYCEKMSAYLTVAGACRLVGLPLPPMPRVKDVRASEAAAWLAEQLQLRADYERMLEKRKDEL